MSLISAGITFSAKFLASLNTNITELNKTMSALLERVEYQEKDIRRLDGRIDQIEAQKKDKLN